MTAANVISGTRSPESATAIRHQWLAMFTDTTRMGSDTVVELASGLLKQVLNEQSGGRGADVVFLAAPAHSTQETACKLAAFAATVDFKSLKIVLEPSS